MMIKGSIKNMLSAHGDLSTKRVAGLGGFIVIFLCYAWCCINGLQMPDVTEFLSGCCVALLGIDPVANIFKQPKNNNNESVEQTD